MKMRRAVRSDAYDMAYLLNAIVARGGSTAHRTPFDAERIARTFFDQAFAISCFCAADEQKAVGFQSLEWSDPDWPGPDPLPSDWGIISTFVDLRRHREGIGRRLFNATLAAARSAGVTQIGATIRRENLTGQKFYCKLGFSLYRSTAETVSMRFGMEEPPFD